jgi:hypothetical protein
MTVLPVFRNGPLNFGGGWAIFFEKKKFIMAKSFFESCTTLPQKLNVLSFVEFLVYLVAKKVTCAYSLP